MWVSIKFLLLIQKCPEYSTFLEEKTCPRNGAVSANNDNYSDSYYDGDEELSESSTYYP